MCSIKPSNLEDYARWAAKYYDQYPDILVAAEYFKNEPTWKTPKVIAEKPELYGDEGEYADAFMELRLIANANNQNRIPFSEISSVCADGELNANMLLNMDKAYHSKREFTVDSNGEQHIVIKLVNEKNADMQRWLWNSKIVTQQHCNKTLSAGSGIVGHQTDCMELDINHPAMQSDIF